MVSELEQAKTLLESAKNALKDYSVFDPKFKQALEIGAKCIGIVQRIGELKDVIKKE